MHIAIVLIFLYSSFWISNHLKMNLTAAFTEGTYRPQCMHQISPKPFVHPYSFLKKNIIHSSLVSSGGQPEIKLFVFVCVCAHARVCVLLETGWWQLCSYSQFYPRTEIQLHVFFSSLSFSLGLFCGSVLLFTLITHLFSSLW